MVGRANAPGGAALVHAASLVPSIVLRELSEGDGPLSRGAPSGPVRQPPFLASIVELRVYGWQTEFDDVSPPEGASAEAEMAFRSDVEDISRGIHMLYTDVNNIVSACGGDLVSYDGTTMHVLFDSRIALAEGGDQLNDAGEDSDVSEAGDSQIEAQLATDCAVRLLKHLTQAQSSNRYGGAALDYRIAVATGEVQITHVGADENQPREGCASRGAWGCVFSSGDEPGEVPVFSELSSILEAATPDLLNLDQPCVVVSDEVWKEVQGSYKEVNQVMGDYHLITLRDVLSHDAPPAYPWKRRVSPEAEGKVALYTPGRANSSQLFRGTTNPGRDHTDRCVVVALHATSSKKGRPLTEEDLQILFAEVNARSLHIGAIPFQVGVSPTDPSVFRATLVGVPPGPTPGEKKVVNRMPHYAISLARGIDEALGDSVNVTACINAGWVYRRALSTPFPKPSVIAAGLSGSAASRESLWTSRSSLVAFSACVTEAQRAASIASGQGKRIVATTVAKRAITDRKKSGLAFAAADAIAQGIWEIQITDGSLLPALVTDGADPGDAGAAAGGGGETEGNPDAENAADGASSASAAAGGPAPVPEVTVADRSAAVRSAAQLHAGDEKGTHAAGGDKVFDAAGSGGDKSSAAKAGKRSNKIHPEADARPPADKFSYGRIHFEEENRDALYVVAPNDNDVGDDFLFWLIDFWQLDMPKMLISITGGAFNFHRAPYTIKVDGAGKDGHKREELVKVPTAWDQVFGHAEKDKMNDDLKKEMALFESKISQLFSRGICRSAVKARAWILTGGSNSGVMELAGQGIRDNAFGTPCIGILTYDLLHEKDRFRATPEQIALRHKNEEYQFRTLSVGPPPAKPARNTIYLEPNHTHFVMIETGIESFGGEVRFRFQIEADLVALVPAVLVVANGGDNTVKTVIESVRQARPIIVIQGTGRFADNLAREYEKKKLERDKNKGQMLAKLREEMQKREQKKLERQTKRKLREKRKKQLLREEKERTKRKMAELEAEFNGGKGGGSGDHDNNGGGGQGGGGKGAGGSSSGPGGKRRGRRGGGGFGGGGGGGGGDDHDDLKTGNNGDDAMMMAGGMGPDLDTDDESEDLIALEVGELADDDVGAGADGKIKDIPVVSEFVSTENPLLAEIVSDGDIYVFNLEKDPLTKMDEIIVRSLFKQPMPEERNTRLDREALNYAWRDYARYDFNAKKAKKLNMIFMYTLLLLNLIATLLAVIQQQMRNSGTLTTGADKTLQTMIIIVPIVTGITLSINSRFNPLVRWLVLRGAAEQVRSAIYLYRVRHESYQGVNNNGDSRMLKMQHNLDSIQQAIYKTEVNQTSVVDPGAEYMAKIACTEKDRFSMLMPDNYYSVRVLRELAYYRRKMPQLERQLRTYQLIIYVVSGGAAILGMFGAELWVAFTTAIVSALTTLLEYNQVQGRLMRYNAAAAELAAVRTWWKALSAVEKASPVLMKSLVDTTESILANELASWVQNQKPKDEENEGGEDGEIPAIQRMRNPRQYARERASELFNLRGGVPRFPIRPGSVKTDE